jgi:hypothetical protein
MRKLPIAVSLLSFFVTVQAWAAPDGNQIMDCQILAGTVGTLAANISSTATDEEVVSATIHTHLRFRPFTDMRDLLLGIPQDERALFVGTLRRYNFHEAYKRAYEGCLAQY